MEHDPGNFEQRDLAAEAASLARARADIAAGRVYSHALARQWFATFGDEDFRPFKEWLAARNG